MSNSNPNEAKNSPPVSPINIATTRGRRGSIASSIPALSTSPTSPLQTPASAFSLRLNQHVRARSGSGSGSDEGGIKPGGPGGSPTSPLGYFLGTTSPFKSTTGAGTAGSFFGGKIASGMEEDDDGPPGAGAIGLFGMGGHTRRASASWTQTGATPGPPVLQSPTKDRGSGVLRRLSLSTQFQRPTFNNNNNSPSSVPPPPPPSAVTLSPARSFAAPAPKPPTPPTNGKNQPLRRAATLAVSDPVKKRGISPMGERLLKGQFDGF